MYVAGMKDVGKVRSQNQDEFFVCNEPIGPFPNLFIVADGMGGHKAGDVASKTAVDVFSQYIRGFFMQNYVIPNNYADLMTNAAVAANKAIMEKAEADNSMRGMGTTLTACVVAHNTAYINHIGDSRAYAITHTEIRQLTTDHTYVNEMIKLGRITEEEAHNHPKRHMLTKVLGASEKLGDLGMENISIPIHDVNFILLCSDGLTNMLDDEIMKRIVLGVGYVENRIKSLVDEANKRGGQDNITAVLIEIKR